MRQLDVRTVTACLAAAVLAVGAVNCNRSQSEESGSDESAQEPSESAEAQSPGEEGEGGEDDSNGDENESDDGNGGDEGGAAPSADVYPTIQLGELSDEDRRSFVSAAKEELCPCPDANSSLHKCLQSSGGTCSLARRAAMVMAQGFNTGASRSDVQSRVAKFLEQSDQKYDFELEGVPHKGPADAPVRIVEFADFQCPHCKRASSMLKEVMGQFDGGVVHYFKHYPLPAHEHAELAARASVAAHRQNKFWPMHDLLFENQSNLSRETVLSLARRIGLNVSKFKQDLGKQEVARQVQRDKQEGRSANVKGTPAIFINGRKHVGPRTADAVAQAVRAELEDGSDSDREGGPEGNGGESSD